MPRNCASLATRLHTFLRGVRDELFGFTAVLADVEPCPSEHILETMRDLADAAGFDEGLWVSAAAFPLLESCLVCEGIGESPAGCRGETTAAQLGGTQ